MFYAYKDGINVAGSVSKEKLVKLCEKLKITDYTISQEAPRRPKVEFTASLEELKKQKHNAAGAAFAAKRDAIRYIKISDGNTYGFDCANEDITNFFASWKAAERDGQTPYKVWLNDTTKGMIIMQLSDFDSVFDMVRDSQISAYAWYETIVAQIEAATTKEELEAVVLE